MVIVGPWFPKSQLLIKNYKETEVMESITTKINIGSGEKWDVFFVFSVKGIV